MSREKTVTGFVITQYHGQVFVELRHRVPALKPSKPEDEPFVKKVIPIANCAELDVLVQMQNVFQFSSSNILRALEQMFLTGWKKPNPLSREDTDKRTDLHSDTTGIIEPLPGKANNMQGWWGTLNEFYSYDEVTQFYVLPQDFSEAYPCFLRANGELANFLYSIFQTGKKESEYFRDPSE